MSTIKTIKMKKLKHILNEVLSEARFYVTYNKGRGQGKGLIRSAESDYEDPRVFRNYNDAEKYVKMAKSSGASPGRITAYWVSDINMNRIDKRGKIIEGKHILKEMTDYDFKGSEVISRINRRQPDLFGKQLFADILPKGEASEAKAIKALKDHDRSFIKKRMDRFAPMFLHIQYHEFEHEGQEYRLHQTQYYNSNFEDKDPKFNPKVTAVVLMKLIPGTKDTEDIGAMLVKTDEYVKDLNRLKITKKAM